MVSILSQLKNLLISKQNIFDKKNITILVTDSGIGGLSVANDLYSFFENNRYYNSVDIIFSDCRNGKIGYNLISDVKSKIKLFSEKLFQLDEKFNPDIIFIACNTLSVLLNQTEFFCKNKKPIIDICGISLKLMIDSLNKEKGLFILGTNTTIGQNYYKDNLICLGFDKKNIVNQLCPNLAKYIEYSYYYSDIDLRSNIRWLTNRIKEKKPNHFNKYAVSFNCTHYYYAVKYFQRYFSKINEYPEFICPNIQMKNIFTDYLDCYNFNRTDVKLFVYNPSKSKKYRQKILFFSKNKNLYFLI